MDPLAVPLIIEVRPDLGSDGFIQLGCVPGAHGSLGKLKEKSAALEKRKVRRRVGGWWPEGQILPRDPGVGTSD